MTFEAVYCPQCGYCHPRVENAHTLPCGHSIVGTVQVTREVVGAYEYIWMKVRNSFQAGFWLRPDGNGKQIVEYKPKGKEKQYLMSLSTHLARLKARAPVLAAAFEARRDVRRGAVALI